MNITRQGKQNIQAMMYLHSLLLIKTLTLVNNPRHTEAHLILNPLLAS